MPYDELGNFYGSDEDLGALEAKYTKPDLASQIPGQVSSSKSDEPKSLRERAVSALTQANPLMMAKSFQDMTKTLVGGAALPVVAPISAGVQALNALPGNMLRRSRGEEEIKTPSANELMRKYGEAIAPQTPAGQNFQEGVGKLMETLKVPHAWPLTPAGPRRPMLTPTDVRVGAGQVKQLAKELRETPADFQAAQSGLKRQNLYGEDTIGVKAQAAADALGDTLERRKSAGLSTIPGVPQALTPETKLYAVRPKGSRLVQPKVPESAKGYIPEFNTLNDIVADVYGDTPASQMPPEMVMAEYARRYLRGDTELYGAITNYGKLKAQEMFPDAPTPVDAQRAYDVLYSNRTERNKQQLADVEEFLGMPENAAYRETTPTPSEFMQRMAEAERVIKGPFTTYLSKNVGAEGDPTVKLARQGITFETPEAIGELAQFANPADLAQKRTAAGFPAMGSFYEERMAKTGELDRLNAEIEALEDARRPLFNRAHDEGIDPASIPEYAETTNPLRQKLRQAEQLKGELENIKLATKVEDIGDSAVTPRTKKSVLSDLSFTEQQFFPSVTKAGEGETMYAGRKGLIRDLGFEKLGKELVEDILTGKAGDTSKLTIENYMREKGLSRIEAEKAAKLQQQQYRVNLQNTLLDRLKNDQNVKTFGNAAIITLDKNTPKDVAMRDMSADTAVLDHCVGQCGTAPQGRKNILTGQQQYYEPVIDPLTGERHARGGTNTSYVNELERGSELVSVRDVKTGLPAATIQLNPTSMSRELSDGTFNIGYASGTKNGAVAPEYVDAIKDYLNSRSSSIKNTGPNLVDNTGIFDTTAPGEWRRVTKEAGLSKDQATAFEAEMDIPRFVTVKDIKEMSKEYLTIEQPSQSRSLAVVDRNRMPDMPAEELLSTYRDQLTQGQQNWLSDFMDRFDTQVDDTGPGRAREDALLREYDRWSRENTLQIGDPMPDNMDVMDLLRAHGDRMTDRQRQWLENFASRWEREVDGTPEGERIQEEMIDDYDRFLSNNRLQPDPLANLFDDLEPDPTAVANRPTLPQPPEARVLAIADMYSVPPDIVRSILQEANGPTARMVELQEQAADLTGMFRTLNARSSEGVIYLIDDLLADRDQAPGLQGPNNAPVFSLVQQYDIPPVTVREIQARFAAPDSTVASLSRMRDSARTGAERTIFHTLSEESREGAARMITDEINRRMAEAPAQPAARARRVTFNEFNGDLTFREAEQRIQQIASDPAYTVRQLRRLSGLIENPDHPQFRVLDQDQINGLNAIIDGGLQQRRQGRQALAQPAPTQPAAQLAERLPIPREVQVMAMQDLVQGMTPAWNRQAQELADTYFNDNVIDGNDVTISALSGMLRNYRVGPHADAPFEVRELAARRLEGLHNQAMMDAEQIADTINEAFYDDAEGPEEARTMIRRDIRTLEENGERAWEDLVGPMIEDYPWSRNLQHHLIQYLRNMLELRDGYAKGGMVKKKRKAKKPTMALVVTRKNPGLAEMAYRYGGMVR
jgi:hypothetical protein